MRPDVAANRTLLTVALVLTATACDAGLSEPEETLAPSAALYLEAALDIMEFNSVRMFEIDWPTFREQTIADAGTASNTFETYSAIEDALARIGDGHSFFRPAQGAPAVAPAPTTGIVGLIPGLGSRAQVDEPGPGDPSANLLEGGIGYVHVPQFDGGGEEGNDLAAGYHRLIEGIDTLGVTCRWVVDLRGNRGGNMWPMVAGVGPILGEGDIGAFFYPDSISTPWFYEAGEAGVEGIPFVLTEDPYTLESPLPFVAVLTDTLTASSGEAVAVAFRAREGARSFGEPTWGVSTANAAFPLSDGAVIFLTVATLADRSGEVYGAELVPDSLLTGGEKTGDVETDAVLAAAAGWLLEQTCG